MILPCFNLITKPFDEQAKKLEPFKWADPEIGKRNKIGGIPDGIKEEDFPDDVDGIIAKAKQDIDNI